MASKGLKANIWVNQVQSLINGKGGGKDLSAQATGSNTDCVGEVMRIVTAYACEKLNLPTPSPSSGGGSGDTG